MAAVILNIACYFVVIIVGDKIVVCVHSGRSGCVHFLMLQEESWVSCSLIRKYTRVVGREWKN